MRQLPKAPISIQRPGSRVPWKIACNHLECAVQAPCVSRIHDPFPGRLHRPPSGELFVVGQLHQFTNSASVRNHDRCAALDRPSHHEGCQTVGIHWKPLPVVPDNRRAFHLLGAIENAKALRRIQNPLSRDHPDVPDRDRSRHGRRYGRSSIPSVQGRPACRVSTRHGRVLGATHCGGLSVSWRAGASTSPLACRLRRCRARRCRCSQPRGIGTRAVRPRNPLVSPRARCRGERTRRGGFSSSCSH